MRSRPSIYGDGESLKNAGKAFFRLEEVATGESAARSHQESAFAFSLVLEDSAWTILSVAHRARLAAPDSAVAESDRSPEFSFDSWWNHLVHEVPAEPAMRWLAPSPETEIKKAC